MTSKILLCFAVVLTVSVMTINCRCVEPVVFGGCGGYQQPPIIVKTSRNSDKDILYPLLMLMVLGDGGFGGFF